MREKMEGEGKERQKCENWCVDQNAKLREWWRPCDTVGKMWGSQGKGGLVPKWFSEDQEAIATPLILWDYGFQPPLSLLINAN